ncbi:MAG: hypothetical protein AAF843_08860 [Bacteroidota bacterium]
MRVNYTFSCMALLCLFLTLCYQAKGQSQDPPDSVLSLPTTRYLSLGFGSAYLKLNDEHMSPLNYNGGSIYAQLGAFKRKKNSIRNLAIGGSYITLGPMEDNREIDPRGQYLQLDINYAQHWYVKSLFNKTVRWYAGGKLNSHSNIRLNEQLDGAFITFLFSNGVYASSLMEREVHISGRPVTISWQMDLPVVNHLIRPNYLNIYDFVNPEGDWLDERLEDSNWRTINSFTNIVSTISLIYPLSTSNALRLSYEWDFYCVRTGLPATSATHSFIFAFLFHY